MTITVTMTPQQYDMFLKVMDEAKTRDLAIAEWTGETVAEIEARYQFPHEDVLADMADAFFAQTTGIPMF